MHPELIRALGRERHAELLRAQHFRHRHAPAAVHGETATRPRPTRRVRISLGSALVAAGTWLLRGSASAVDLFDTHA